VRSEVNGAFRTNQPIGVSEVVLINLLYALNRFSISGPYVSSAEEVCPGISEITTMGKNRNGIGCKFGNNLESVI